MREWTRGVEGEVERGLDGEQDRELDGGLDRERSLERDLDLARVRDCDRDRDSTNDCAFNRASVLDVATGVDLGLVEAVSFSVFVFDARTLVNLSTVLFGSS